jgi:hypothetical protein
MEAGRQKGKVKARRGEGKEICGGRYGKKERGRAERGRGKRRGEGEIVR